MVVFDEDFASIVCEHCKDNFCMILRQDCNISIHTQSSCMCRKFTNEQIKELNESDKNE